MDSDRFHHPVRIFLLTLICMAAFVAPMACGAPGGSTKPDRVDAGLSLPAAAGGRVEPFRCAPQGGKAAVALFLTIDCPIANRYAPEIERIRRDYEARGVRLTLVHVDPDLSDAAALAHARQFGLGAPVAVDRAHAAVRAASARFTPEAVVVDPAGRIRYRGRIDDQFADYGARRVEPSRRELREALDALLAGRPVAVPETAALGCHIPVHDPTGAASSPAATAR